MSRGSPVFMTTTDQMMTDTDTGGGQEGFRDTGQHTATHATLGDFTGNSAGGIAFSDTHIGASA